ncbi:MAG: TlpA family protein disulfide reductase [Deltaproteobacteria bacterium]|nr:TlpA family protein disulfide reductase [Deltaproteobacteria bacterium]
MDRHSSPGLTSAVLLLALALAVASGCCPPSGLVSTPQRAAASEPQQVPLSTMSGQQTTLAGYRGRVVLVDFWASWCAPCRMAFPYYADILARQQGQGFAVVAISIDEDLESARSFARRWRLPFDVLHDGKRQAAAAFSVYQIPVCFLLDRAGRVRFVHHGFDSSRARELEEQVLLLLGEPAPRQ